jgi:predicted transcriptional regulator
VASITINLPDTQLQRLQQLAQENGISLEDLLRASIEDCRSYPKSEFVQASSYVLKKMLNCIDAWHDTLPNALNQKMNGHGKSL